MKSDEIFGVTAMVLVFLLFLALIIGITLASSQDRHRHQIQNQACIAAGKQVFNDQCIDHGVVVVS